MSEYTQNGQKLRWGPGVVVLNPEKAALLKKYATGKCLDLGCGSGIYSGYLASLGFDVTGVDDEKEFVQKASRSYPEVKFIKSNAVKLPFKKKQFDTVVLFDIVEHLDETSILKEAFRVGKRLIISVPHTNQKILSEYSLVHSHYLDKTHLRTYTPITLRKALKKMQAKIILCRPSLRISVSGLLIHLLSHRNIFRQILLKILLKPFLPEPSLYSTVFAVA